MNTNIKKIKDGKTISVKDLPNCFFKERLLDFCKDKNSKVAVVAKAENPLVGDWSAYIGWPELDELKYEYQSIDSFRYYCLFVHSASQVKSYGDKLDRETAEYLFPDWTHLKYRG